MVGTSLGETHAVSLGAGSQVCVYLPGTNFNASSSTVVLGALAARFRVYAADLPGQPGLSAADRPDDERSGYAAWVSELIDWVARTGRRSAASFSPATPVAPQSHSRPTRTPSAVWPCSALPD